MMTRRFLQWTKANYSMGELLQCNTVKDIKKMFLKYMYPEGAPNKGFIEGAKFIDLDGIMKFVEKERQPTML